MRTSMNYFSFRSSGCGWSQVEKDRGSGFHGCQLSRQKQSPPLRVSCDRWVREGSGEGQKLKPRETEWGELDFLLIFTSVWCRRPFRGAQGLTGQLISETWEKPFVRGEGCYSSQNLLWIRILRFIYLQRLYIIEVCFAWSEDSHSFFSKFTSILKQNFK